MTGEGHERIPPPATHSLPSSSLPLDDTRPTLPPIPFVTSHKGGLDPLPHPPGHQYVIQDGPSSSSRGVIVPPLPPPSPSRMTGLQRRQRSPPPISVADPHHPPSSGMSRRSSRGSKLPLPASASTPGPSSEVGRADHRRTDKRPRRRGHSPHEPSTSLPSLPPATHLLRSSRGLTNLLHTDAPASQLQDESPLRQATPPARLSLPLPPVDPVVVPEGSSSAGHLPARYVQRNTFHSRPGPSPYEDHPTAALEPTRPRSAIVLPSLLRGTPDAFPPPHPPPPTSSRAAPVAVDPTPPPSGTPPASTPEAWSSRAPFPSRTETQQQEAWFAIGPSSPREIHYWSRERADAYNLGFEDALKAVQEGVVGIGGYQYRRPIFVRREVPDPIPQRELPPTWSSMPRTAHAGTYPLGVPDPPNAHQVRDPQGFAIHPPPFGYPPPPVGQPWPPLTTPPPNHAGLYNSHVNPRTSPPSSSNKPSRQLISCYPCRSRKLKCDGNQPCSQCVRRGGDTECTYAPSVRRRGKGKKSIFSEGSTSGDGGGPSNFYAPDIEEAGNDGDHEDNGREVETRPMSSGEPATEKDEDDAMAGNKQEIE